MAKKAKGKVKRGKAKKGTGASSVGVSLNPESFIQMGLPDHFEAEIENAVWFLFNFPKKDGTVTMDGYRVCARFYLTPDEDSGIEPFDQPYSAASAEWWVPANVEDDELVPVDVEAWNGEDYDQTEGTHIMPTEELVERLNRTGKPAQLPKGTNFDIFLGKLGEVGFTDWPQDGSLSSFIGMRAQFDRVHVEGREGEVLVITEILGRGGKGSGKTGRKVSGKKTGKADKAGKAGKGEDAAIKAKLEEIVGDILTEKPMSRKKLITKVIQSGKLGNKEKRVALSLLADSSEFMGEDERPWMYDEDDDTFWLGDEEEIEEDEEEEEEEGDVDEEDEEEEEEEEED